MYQYDDPTAVAALPAPAAAGTPGYFTDGSPVAAEPATILRSDFMNMLMMELLNVVEASGQAPSKTTYNQVLAALQACFSPVVGQARNLSMVVASASSSATLTAEEVVVKSALGGMPFVLKSFNKTINLATTGAGGMDTGTAPVSGFVALYAIFNPTSGASALLATNTTSAAAPSVYGGANMPSGYTASGLVGVVPTNSSSQFPIFTLRNRKVYFVNTQAASTSSQITTPTAVSISNVVPQNAITIDGLMSINSTSASNAAVTMFSTSISSGGPAYQVAGNSTGNTLAPFADFPLLTAQKIWWQANVSSGTFNTANITVTAYEF